MTDAPVGSAGSEWIERLQEIVDAAVARTTASTASFERLLASAAGADPAATSTNDWAQLGYQVGTEAYEQLGAVTSRFLGEVTRLVARYRDEYLGELIPEQVMMKVGPPPAVPVPPVSGDSTAWTAWYQLYAAWSADQQTWSGRLLSALRDEVSAGRLQSDSVPTSARAFLQRRLPDYLVDMAELNAALASDVLGVADASFERMAETLSGRPGVDEMIVDVSGGPGETVTTSLMVENGHTRPQLVSCHPMPADSFGIVSAPQQFQLVAGESRRVAIRVMLPSGPADEPVDAGSVAIRGTGERDLLVRVRAAVTAETTSDITAEPGGGDIVSDEGGDGAGDS
jgi:hypothetical protein